MHVLGGEDARPQKGGGSPKRTDIPSPPSAVLSCPVALDRNLHWQTHVLPPRHTL